MLAFMFNLEVEGMKEEMSFAMRCFYEGYGAYHRNNFRNKKSNRSSFFGLFKKSDISRKKL